MSTYSAPLNWYTAYTYPKSEKKVNSALAEVGLESFLPLQQVIRQWSDRKKKLLVPLIPNYVFVKTEARQVYKLLKINGIIRFLATDKKLAIISDDEISYLRKMINGNFIVEKESFEVTPGQRARIIGGVLKGFSGKILQQNGKYRVLIRINSVKQAFSVEIASEFLELISSND